jgi:hypothetical protein
MATLAERGAISGQQTLVGRSMWSMAAGAFSFFDQRVQETTFQGLLKGLMALQTYFPFCAGLEFEFIF